MSLPSDLLHGADVDQREPLDLLGRRGARLSQIGAFSSIPANNGDQRPQGTRQVNMIASVQPSRFRATEPGQLADLGRLGQEHPQEPIGGQLALLAGPTTAGTLGQEHPAAVRADWRWAGIALLAGPRAAIRPR